MDYTSQYTDTPAFFRGTSTATNSRGDSFPVEMWENTQVGMVVPVVIIFEAHGRLDPSPRAARGTEKKGVVTPWLTCVLAAGVLVSALALLVFWILVR